MADNAVKNGDMKFGVIPKKPLHIVNHNLVLTKPLTSSDIIELEHIEAFFFAYRDFVADADRILEKLGFGRAHHRVLFFVNRRTGMTVAELLEILKITKQSLSRVLRQLINAGYIAQETGSKDRRQRLLYPTQKGRELVLELSRPQSRRIHAALKKSGLNGSDLIARFMAEMTNAAQKG